MRVHSEWFSDRNKIEIELNNMQAQPKQKKEKLCDRATVLAGPPFLMPF